MLFESDFPGQSRPGEIRPLKIWSNLPNQGSPGKVGGKALFGFLLYVHFFYKDLIGISLALRGIPGEFRGLINCFLFLCFLDTNYYTLQTKLGIFSGGKSYTNNGAPPA